MLRMRDGSSTRHRDGLTSAHSQGKSPAARAYPRISIFGNDLGAALHIRRTHPSYHGNAPAHHRNTGALYEPAGRVWQESR